MKKLFAALLAALMLLPAAGTAGTDGGTDAVSDSGWKAAYRDFITSGSYRRWIRAADPLFTETVAGRETGWDSFAAYDMDLDGVPELLVGVEYGVEQVDVFTWQAGEIWWMGTMGGHNFFQYILSYDEAGIPGKLYTLTGGPAMEIDEYRLVPAGIVRSDIGRTLVNESGDDTVGVELTAEDARLERLLGDTLLGGADRAEYLVWFLPDKLQTEDGWDALFSAERTLAPR